MSFPSLASCKIMRCKLKMIKCWKSRDYKFVQCKEASCHSAFETVLGKMSNVSKYFFPDKKIYAYDKFLSIFLVTSSILYSKKKGLSSITSSLVCFDFQI